MATKAKKKTLADKISSLITAAPVQFGSDDEADLTSAKVIEKFEESDNSDNEFRQSKIRRQNVDLLDKVDKRYKGKKVSRKDLDSEEEIDGDNSDTEQSDAESHIENAESEEDDMSDTEMLSEDNDNTDNSVEKGESDMDSESNDSAKKTDSDEEEEDLSDDDDDDDDDHDSASNDEDHDVDIGNPLRRNRKLEGNFKTMTETNLNADIEKGNCVRRQLKVWEQFLEMRIQLQKCLASSNQMPQYDVHKNFRTEVDYMNKTNETKNKLSDVLDKLLTLQTTLLKQYPETKSLGTDVKNSKSSKRKAEESDEEIPSDTEDEAELEEEVDEYDESESDTKKADSKIPKKKRKFSEYEKILAERHKSYTKYRDSVIQKWNDKTRITTGIFNKGSQETTLKQIEFALHDKDKLRKRTQLKRSEYVILGKTVEEKEDDEGRRTQERDPEIFDDDDFYHQLLRDLIEHKCSGVTDPVQLSKQWVQLQNIRSKMKRKIDTRATKGRKVRYNVHNKLVNFMAPITTWDTWTDSAKNELYNSLFGRIKSTDN